MIPSFVRRPGVSSVAAVASVFPLTVDALNAFVASANTKADADVAAIEGATSAAVESNSAVPFHQAREIDLAASEYSARVSVISVVKNVATDKALRDAATEALVQMQSKSIDLFSSNRKLYRALKRVPAESIPLDPATDDGASVPAQQRYWLEDKVSEYERDGHGLDDERFAEVVKVKKELSALTTKFMTRINEDKTTLVFTREELEGVPDSILKGLKTQADVPEADSIKGDQALVVRLDYPVYFGIMKNCTNAKTRREVGRAFVQRASGNGGNEATMNDVVALRHKLAHLLGFNTYAELDLASKMAKTPATAQHFVDALVPGLQKKWEQEAAKLKQELPASVELDSQGRFSPYDLAFLMNQYKKNHLSVDDQEIQKYFPMENTISVLLTIYERFFDVTFVHHHNTDDNKLGLWHHSASVIEVRDNRGSKTHNLIGHIVLDLYPREGKYSHACCHAAVPAVRQEADGAGSEFTPALSVVLANFPAATADEPSLLLHSDAETFFHEFGHAMHGMFGRSAMALHAGTRVKRDFVELPSQILEEWLWNDEILKMVTKHYKTGESLPEGLMNQKVASKTAFSGYESLRQLQFATLSLQLFGEPLQNGVAPDEFFTNQIQPRIMPGIAYDSASRFTSSFGHLMGYAATYYGYMWSEVFAVDVFEAIERDHGLLNGAVGRRYAKSILEVGGGRDPEDMLTEFLGRKPNNEAFLRKLGISAGTQ
jgi:thimet oligopeptidase